MGGIRPGLALLGLLLLALPRPALADEAGSEAERLIRRGIELRKAHDDPGAVPLFQKAYDLVHSPRAAGQLGLAEQALGRWEEAEQHVREALHADGDAWVAKNHATLADALGLIEGHLARVEVIGGPEGAEVLVNGRTVGHLPLPEAVAVSAGGVDIELQAPGYEPAQRTISVGAGQYQRVVLRLAKSAEPAGAVDTPRVAAAVDAPRAAEPTAPPPVAAGRIQARPVTEGPSTARTALKWTVAGLALGSLAVGVTFTFIQRKNVAAFDSYKDCANDGGTAVIRGTTIAKAACQPALDDYLLDEKVAIAGYVGAGVFALTWLVLQLTEPAPAASTGERALALPPCAPSPGRVGLACAWTF